MEFIILVIILITILVFIKIIYKINVKELKDIAEDNKELDNLVQKYPSNTKICEDILKMLNNENVKIEEQKDSESSLYIVVTNKIIIANLRKSFTRIQTIAHECLHSIQDRNILLFNYFYSLFYLSYFYITIILFMFNLVTNKMLFVCIQIILGYIYFFTRSYLENDAMIKARFLAQDYMEEKKISSKDEIKKILKVYDRLNNIGIKTINYSLLTNTIIRTLIIIIVLIIRGGI